MKKIDTNISLSNFLILISFIITFISYFYSDLFTLWMNRFFIEKDLPHILLLQFCMYQFLHWWIFHLLANSIFIYIFWNQIEYLIWKTKFFLFFLFNTLFVWTMLLFFSSWNTIWISWFCMALISFFTLELYFRKNPEYKWWITAILLNIAIWFYPWISLAWHLFWAIAWIIFYFLSKKDLLKNMIVSETRIS